MKKNLHILSLGCPKARVDTEVMLGQLRKTGWSLTPDPERADAIVINTCAFLQESIEESIDEILAYADYKVSQTSGCGTRPGYQKSKDYETEALYQQQPELPAMRFEFAWTNLAET